ncbi:hypothetical protein BC830DRAFT_1103308 [Chytriomyces sp. MP71]|nr:hypothetical protein BC830DRAFT_1103308 [Chytriomyces sp. MP71]
MVRRPQGAILRFAIGWSEFYSSCSPFLESQATLSGTLPRKTTLPSRSFLPNVSSQRFARWIYNWTMFNSIGLPITTAQPLPSWFCPIHRFHGYYPPRHSVWKYHHTMWKAYVCMNPCDQGP